MSGLRWDKARLRGRATEEAFPKDEPVKGGWSHVKPEPVKRYTPEERAEFLRKRRDESS